MVGGGCRGSLGLSPGQGGDCCPTTESRSRSEPGHAGRPRCHLRRARRPWRVACGFGGGPCGRSPHPSARPYNHGAGFGHGGAHRLHCRVAGLPGGGGAGFSADYGSRAHDSGPHRAYRRSEHRVCVVELFHADWHGAGDAHGALVQRLAKSVDLRSAGGGAGSRHWWCGQCLAGQPVPMCSNSLPSWLQYGDPRHWRWPRPSYSTA